MHVCASVLVAVAANLAHLARPLPAEWLLTQGGHPGNTSVAARRLAGYLEACAAAIPDNDAYHLLPFHNSYSEHPKTTAGRYIRCLAQHPDARSTAVLFYGYPGPNGVFSAALGARARALVGAGVARLVTLEGDEHECLQGHQFLRKHRLDGYVDLRCKFLCKGSEEAGCRSEVRRELCPTGPLDLLIEDIVPEGNLALKCVLEVCTPRVLFVENSGIRDTHPWIGSADRSLSGQWWAHYMEDEIHVPAAVGRGAWRIAVDKRLSGFAADAGLVALSPLARAWQRLLEGREPEAPRRFSIYVAARGE